jgi:YHS domain-containing protein
MRFVQPPLHLFCVVLAACMGPHAPRDVRLTSECPVCRAEGDLACLEVERNASTPTATYKGKTYVFCTEECRDEFLMHPETYAEQEPER